MNLNRDKMKKAPQPRAKAPWADYDDESIFDGDKIRHPSGETGTVVYCPFAGPGVHDKWVVLYQDGTISRLGPQLCEEGRAVVISPDRITAMGERQRDDVTDTDEL